MRLHNSFWDWPKIVDLWPKRHCQKSGAAVNFFVFAHHLANYQYFWMRPTSGLNPLCDSKSVISWLEITSQGWVHTILKYFSFFNIFAWNSQDQRKSAFRTQAFLWIFELGPPEIWRVNSQFCEENSRICLPNVFEGINQKSRLIILKCEMQFKVCPENFMRKWKSLRILRKSHLGKIFKGDITVLAVLNWIIYDRLGSHPKIMIIGQVIGQKQLKARLLVLRIGPQLNQFWSIWKKKDIVPSSGDQIYKYTTHWLSPWRTFLVNFHKNSGSLIRPDFCRPTIHQAFAALFFFTLAVVQSEF